MGGIMRLKNKKTGEIRELPDGFFCGDNLKKICEEWEDYKEPKGIQCIYYVNHFDAAKIDGVIVGFETKEEAEQAVEKLKAWKRLRDKGLHVTTFYVEDGSLVIRAKTHNSSGAENWEDLDLIFGGENE